ncbi:hypothetical protein D4764_22G0003140 [Takifugu flavidus]|uniref:Sodium/calcium exchanger membrane region domain-containing protein n=1 Tax=Takifugu flavidus TaxID=433684 RepID=A0A5C6NGI5_9TELE|nr:hypothetical protein D4764_22G0003140 [Takifugu flavidus]
MSHTKPSLMPGDGENLQRRSTADPTGNFENSEEPELHHRCRQSHPEWLCVGPNHPEMNIVQTPSPDVSGYHHYHYTPKCFLTIHRGGQGTSVQSASTRCGEEGWHEATTKTTIRADNEVEAHREANNYKFGFRKWKGNVTEKPIEDRSDVIKELYSDLNTASDVVKRSTVKPLMCEVIPEETRSDYSKDLEGEKDSAPLLVSSPINFKIPVPAAPVRKTSNHWCRYSTCVWLLLGYPVVAVVHSLACILSWLLVFTIPVAKMNARMLHTILLMAPEDIHVRKLEKIRCESRVLLCCYRASMIPSDLLPLVITSLSIGYADKEHKYFSAEVIFSIAITSIIPLSYFIGMGIASLSAQSNFAVGAVVNATFGSITEMTFYITALLRGHRAGTRCYEEVVKAALTGTLLGCILFIPGVCMIIGGIKHQEQRFNSRSAGVSSALLFISIGGVFAPTLFSKTFGDMVCDSCSGIPGNATVPFTCRDCHYDTSQTVPHLVLSQIEPLVYTISVLLPAAYLIGLVFTLKTHSHIYDIHISDGHAGHAHGQYAQAGTSTAHPTGEGTTGHPLAANSCINAGIVATSQGLSTGHHVVHWSRWRALTVLIAATVLMACCADLSTENIEPFLNYSISQYFIGVTLLAMVPELPEIVNGIQFALQNNISLSLEVGSCIAVQVCMIQIPLLILFNAFYDVGFTLIFSDIHLWASIFSVILVNYIFMDGKSDYFQGKYEFQRQPEAVFLLKPLL